MGKNSNIEWTHHTFNPWIGCTKVSPGCANCYAAHQDSFRRWTPEGWGKNKPRRRTASANWNQPLKWNREAALEWENWTRAVDAKAGDSGVMPGRPRVFCASLADVFDDEVPVEWLRDLLSLIDETPHLDWLL
jgi:Bacteriophage protein gp37